MIRLTLLSIVIGFFCAYSFKDWYKSLCFLIALLSIIEHPDVPKTILGIQGLNPWNIVFFFVLLGFIFDNKQNRGINWKTPDNLWLYFVLYMLFCLVAYFRMTGDLKNLIEYNALFGEDPPTRLGLLSEHVINVIKWVVPGLLLFYGCNSYKRFVYGALSALSIYFFLGLLTIKAMPLAAITDADRLEYLARKLLQDNVGYHRVNLAMMFSGAFWAVFTLREISTTKNQRLFIYLSCAIILFALALSGGRTGYATWAAIGALFAFFKWRRFLFYGPIVALIIISLVPAARDRFLMGFSEDTVDERNSALVDEGLINENSNVDLYTITSGRTIAWPFVIDKIKESPIFGYGKEAMIRTGLSAYLWTSFQEGFPHPHNMYLQWTLDNGIIGIIPVLIFYYLALKYAFSLFRDTRSPIFVFVGGAALSLILALFIAGFGSQTFYPREGAVAMWCIIGLMLRVYILRKKVIDSTDPKDIGNPISADRLWSPSTQQITKQPIVRPNFYR